MIVFDALERLSVRLLLLGAVCHEIFARSRAFHKETVPRVACGQSNTVGFLLAHLNCLSAVVLEFGFNGQAGSPLLDTAYM